MSSRPFMADDEPGGVFHRELAEWLASRYGLDLGVLGRTALDETLRARARETGAEGFDAYAMLWRRQPDERAALLRRLLVGETWFFREWSAFQCLRDWLLRHGHRFSAGEPLRVLSLPCATGEEAWSIAAIVDEAGLDDRRARIDAMDINADALRQAELGVYPRRRLRGQALERWPLAFLAESEDTFRVAAPLRALVRFLEGNAMELGPLRKLAPYHIIFCRNMLIYMNPAARHRICMTLSQCLSPEGLLFLGHAEVAPAGLGLARSEFHGAFAWRRVNPGAAGQSTPPVGRSLLPISTDRPARPAVTAPAEAPRRPPDAVAAPVATPAAIDLARLRGLADRGCYAEALRGLESPDALASLDPETHALAGVILAALGRKAEASTRWRRALYLDPAHAESLAHLALMLDEQGDPGGAERLRQRLAGRTRP